MNVSHLMNKTVTHETKTRTSDNQGGWSFSWSTAGTYKGRLSQPSAGVRQYQDMGKDIGHVSHEVYISPVPTAGTIGAGDRITIDSRTFEVKVPNIQPSIAVYQKLAVLELQDPT